MVDPQKIEGAIRNLRGFTAEHAENTEIFLDFLCSLGALGGEKPLSA